MLCNGAQRQRREHRQSANQQHDKDQQEHEHGIARGERACTHRHLRPRAQAASQHERGRKRDEAVRQHFQAQHHVDERRVGIEARKGRPVVAAG